MDDLHARLLAELDRREAIAKAATEGPWTLRTAGTGIRGGGQPYAFIVRPDGGYVAERHNYGTVDDLRHMVLHDPADALRRYAEDRNIVNEHAPDVQGFCLVDRWGLTAVKSPCAALLSRARSLGLPVDGDQP